MQIDKIKEISGFAQQIPIGSLGGWLRPSKESFARVSAGYLLADQARIQMLSEQISRPGKLLCGVSWSSKNAKIGGHKSLSLAQMLVPLKGEGLHFVNLQYGDTQQEREALYSEHGIEVQDVSQVDNYHDIEGLAALIVACDVVVTTSNTTAHLAGALGKPTLLLLPFGRGQLWYWSHRGRQEGAQGCSAWYPSIRFYQQERPGDWGQALSQVRFDLENKPWVSA